MAIAIVTPEEVEVDVCYGNFDGSYTKTMYVVDFFRTEVGMLHGDLDTSMYIKTEHDAKMMARLYELGMTGRGEYNEITFNKIFEDAEVGEDA
jgi:hypothetical protein